MGISDSKVAERETAEPGVSTRVHGQGASLRRPLGARFLDTYVHGGIVQRQEGAAAAPAPAAGTSHAARLPDSLRTSVERLSGLDMSDVQVHYRSSEPARVQALAYAQGDAIHLGPGQERHLPHEVWHVVQQKQGRVRATSQFVGVGLNDDVGLEHEADRMGAMAARGELDSASSPGVLQAVAAPTTVQQPVQRVKSLEEFKVDTTLKDEKVLGIPMKPRDKVTEVDKLLEQYHKLASAKPSNVDQKKELLNNIDKACDAYLESDKSNRSDGVQRLKAELSKDMMVINPLAECVAEKDPVKQFALIDEGHDAQILLENEGYRPEYQIAFIAHFQILVLAELRKNPDGLNQVLRGDVRALEDLRNDLKTPKLIRDILTEILGNLDDIHLEEKEQPGARFARETENLKETYVLNHALNKPLGKSERLGSLAHELTHVSISKTFDNTALFLDFAKDATKDAILELSWKRTVQLRKLEGLIDTNIFTERQVSLLKEKIQYPTKSIGGYLESFKTAKKIADSTYYKLLSFVKLGLNNTVIEFETVINQMLLYVYLWETDTKNPFYIRLAELAQEAYDYRASARPVTPSAGPSPPASAP